MCAVLLNNNKSLALCLRFGVEIFAFLFLFQQYCVPRGPPVRPTGGRGCRECRAVL